MAKVTKKTESRIKIESEDDNGKTKVVFIKLPDSKVNKDAQLIYNKAFREALQDGAILRQKLNQVMVDQGIWDEGKEEEYNAVLEKISEGEKTLGKGGISLSEARDVAIEMRKHRAEFRSLIAERSAMDGNTAEGQADNERFSHLVYACLLDKQGKKLFSSREQYETLASEPYVIDAAGQLAEKLYGLDPNYESTLPENKFLQSYSLSDDKLRLVNKDGHLIDVDGDGNERLIDEDSRYIAYDDKGESYYIDVDGKKVSEEGEYEVSFSPFLDDSGKPIEVPNKDEDKEDEEEPEESEEVVEAEDKPKPKTQKKTTKRSPAKAQTE